MGSQRLRFDESELDGRSNANLKRSMELLHEIDELLLRGRAVLTAADASIGRARHVAETIEVDLGPGAPAAAATPATLPTPSP